MNTCDNQYRLQRFVVLVAIALLCLSSMLVAEVNLSSGQTAPSQISFRTTFVYPQWVMEGHVLGGFASFCDIPVPPLMPSTVDPGADSAAVLVRCSALDELTPQPLAVQITVSNPVDLKDVFIIPWPSQITIRPCDAMTACETEEALALLFPGGAGSWALAGEGRWEAVIEPGSAIELLYLVPFFSGSGRIGSYFGAFEIDTSETIRLPGPETSSEDVPPPSAVQVPSLPPIDLAPDFAVNPPSLPDLDPAPIDTLPLLDFELPPIEPLQLPDIELPPIESLPLPDIKLQPIDVLPAFDPPTIVDLEPILIPSPAPLTIPPMAVSPIIDPLEPPGQAEEPAPTAQPAQVAAAPTRTPRPTQTPTPIPDLDCMATVIASGAVNLRSGPSTNHAILGSVPRDEDMTVIGQSGEWYEVVYDDTTGWMAGWLLSLSGPCTHLQPITGILQDRQPRGGYGELTVENGRDDDAVAILTQLDGSPAKSAYIRAGESFTITGIADGHYELYFALGEGWDRERLEFTEAARRARFEDLLSFSTTRSATHITYSSYSVTLHGVVGGTAVTRDVPADEFPNLTD